MSTDAILERFAHAPTTLAHLVADASDAQLDAAPAGQWSTRTIMAHLRDDEFLCMRPALERTLAEDSPQVRFIDGSDWEPSRNRTRDRREFLLADFALQRQASAALLRGLRPADWDRTMETSDHGSVSLRQLLDAWTAHDQEHLREIEERLGESLEEVLARRARMVDWRTGRSAGS